MKHWWFSGKIGRCHLKSFRTSNVGQPRVRFPADAFLLLIEPCLLSCCCRSSSHPWTGRQEYKQCDRRTMFSVRAVVMAGVMQGCCRIALRGRTAAMHQRTTDTVLQTTKSEQRECTEQGAWTICKVYVRPHFEFRSATGSASGAWSTRSSLGSDNIRSMRSNQSAPCRQRNPAVICVVPIRSYNESVILPHCLHTCSNHVTVLIFTPDQHLLWTELGSVNSNKPTTMMEFCSYDT